MRVVLTTVTKASVTIDNKLYSSINRGFLLLVGFTFGDNKLIVDKMVDKIISLRVFMDENGKTNKSIYDVNGEIMSVSQFTLYASAKDGRRPSFVNALTPKDAEELYLYFNDKIKEKFGDVKTGIFGADMLVESVNDGPFTLLLNSEELFK